MGVASISSLVGNSPTLNQAADLTLQRCKDLFLPFCHSPNSILDSASSLHLIYLSLHNNTVSIFFPCHAILGHPPWGCLPATLFGSPKTYLLLTKTLIPLAIFFCTCSKHLSLPFYWVSGAPSFVDFYYESHTRVEEASSHPPGPSSPGKRCLSSVIWGISLWEAS